MALLIPGANGPVTQRRATTVVSYVPLPGIDLDVSAFVLGANGKVRSDSDMCFYGQPSVADGAVTIVDSQPGRTEFLLDLGKLDAHVEKVALTATIDENKARFVSYAGIEVRLVGIEAPIPTADRRETALILGEFYRRQNEWKYRNVGQGFEGGLAPLATHFGVEIETPAAVSSVLAVPARISLEKKIATKAPGLVSLAKKASVSLAKQNLTNVTARVALVLDASGSMNGQYKNGRVQEIVNRVLPLAVHFDDNESLDCWAFANKPCRLSDVTLSNYQNFIATDSRGWKDWDVGTRGNNEPAVIDDIVEFYRKTGSRVPVYILFISDGGVSETRKITDRIVSAASLPIFWQFVGIAGSKYGILQKLDEMKGRIVDNCNFFAIDDLHSVTEDVLYDRLMGEFPLWLKAAKDARIID